MTIGSGRRSSPVISLRIPSRPWTCLLTATFYPKDRVLTASAEAVQICRRLADADPAAYETDLATSLERLCDMIDLEGWSRPTTGPFQLHCSPATTTS